MNQEIKKILKILPSGFKSSEFTVLVGFILLILGNLYIGDGQAAKALIESAQLDPTISEIVSLVNTNNTSTQESGRLILYAVLGYFIKRGTLKWKEMEVLKEPKTPVKKKKKKIVKPPAETAAGSES